MRVIIDSGHFDKDSGATYAGYTEYDICRGIISELKKILPDAIFVPDEFNLTQTIKWINSFCNPDDLIIAIHLNSHRNIDVRGCEAYYNDSTYLTDIFSKAVSEALQVPNLGSKHDSESYLGSLGFLRQIKAQTVLIEALYLSNPQDRMKIIMPSGKIACANGIRNGIMKVKADRSTLEALRQMFNRLLALIK